MEIRKDVEGWGSKKKKIHEALNKPEPNTANLLQQQTAAQQSESASKRQAESSEDEESDSDDEEEQSDSESAEGVKDANARK